MCVIQTRLCKENNELRERQTERKKSGCHDPPIRRNSIFPPSVFFPMKAPKTVKCLVAIVLESMSIRQVTRGNASLNL